MSTDADRIKSRLRAQMQGPRTQLDPRRFPEERWWYHAWLEHGGTLRSGYCVVFRRWDETGELSTGCFSAYSSRWSAWRALPRLMEGLEPYVAAVVEAGELQHRGTMFKKALAKIRGEEYNLVPMMVKKLTRLK